MLFTLKSVVRGFSMLVVLIAALSMYDNGATFEARAPRCSYRLWPLSLSFDASGGRASVSVITESYCTWIGSSNQGWLSITSPASGAGEGTIDLTVPANPYAAVRTGTLTVGGEVVAVRQAASADSCAPKRLSRASSSGHGPDPSGPMGADLVPLRYAKHRTDHHPALENTPPGIRIGGGGPDRVRILPLDRAKVPGRTVAHGVKATHKPHAHAGTPIARTVGMRPGGRPRDD
jgi:Viral BACON domain